ncbi:MAG: TolC family protein [Cyclobacteriaceae bacterium]
MKQKLLIFQLIWIPFLGYSQDTLSVDECIRLALENNLTVSNSAYDQQLYKEQIKEAKSGALPRLDASGQYNIYMELPTTVIPNSAFTPGTEGYSAASFGTQHQSTYSLQLSQAIYNPNLGAAIRAADKVNEMGELQYEQTKETVAYQVASTYYNAQALGEQIKMLEGNSHSLDTLITNTRMLEENGLVNRTDIDRLIINKASLDNNIATIKADYDLLINSLKLLLNLDQDTPLRISGDLHPETQTYAQHHDFAIQNRVDYKLLNKQMELLHLQETQVKKGYQPTLSAVATYGLMGFGENEDDFYEHYDFSYVGLQLSWNLFDGMAKRTQVKQKQIQMQQLKSNVELTQRSIENERTNALAKLRTHQTEVENQGRSVDLAIEIYNNIQMQYREGLVGVQEVIQTKDDLIQAETNYLNSWIQLQQAKLDLEKAEGDLLTKYN